MNRAIQKYGWDNFEHIILFEKISQSMASEIEKELILKYHLTDTKYGYNCKNGGIDGLPLKCKHDEWNNIPVYQYNLNGELIREWDDYRKPIHEYRAYYICNVLEEKTLTAAGYMWSFQKNDKILPYDRAINMRQYDVVPILQFSKNGDFIKRYESPYEIFQDKIEVNHLLYSMRSQKLLTFRDYIWVPEDENTKNNVDTIVKRIKKHQHGVIQADLEGNIINIYSSVNEAANAMQVSLSAISQAVKKNGLCQGFQWYNTNGDPPHKYHSRFPKIKQLDDNKCVVNIFPNRAAAADYLGKRSYEQKIKKCCEGLLEKVNGYYWEYEL